MSLAAFPALAGLAAAFTPSATAAPRDQARLLAATAGEVRFEVVAPAPKLAPAGGDAAAGLTRLDWPDWETWGLPGEAPLPVRVVNVAVPPEGEVSVRARGLEAAVTEQAWLAPVTAPGAEGETSQLYVKPRRAPGAAQAGPRVRLAGVSWLRNQRVAQIEVTPAEYDPVAGKLTTYGRVEVTVSLPVAAPGAAPARERAPVADPFEGVYREVVINYEQGKAWRWSRRVTGAAPQPARAQVVPDTSIFPGRPWIRIVIERTGLYKVDGARLSVATSEFPVGSIATDSLRLFVWPGLPVMPESDPCDSCDYREVAIGVVDADADGTLDNSEFIYFWALGPSEWVNLYPGAANDTSYLDNPYETRNYYWLTWGTPSKPVGGAPKRIGTRDQPPTGTGVTPATFPARLHFERDAEYIPGPLRKGLFWEKWFWQSIGPGQTYNLIADAPGADTTQPARLLARFWAGVAGTASVTHRLDVSFNNVAFPSRLWIDPDRSDINYNYFPQNFDSTHVWPLRTTGNVLTASVPSATGAGDRSALAWWELYYRRRFEPVNDTLFFDGPGTATDYDYVVRGFRNLPSTPHVLDVTDALQPVEITSVAWEQVAASPDTFQVRFSAFEPTPHRYWIGPYGFGRTVESVNLRGYRAATNWRSATRAADYVIIYFDGDGNPAASFAAAASQLATHRKQHLYLAGEAPPHQVLEVPISELYNQFSGGRQDPAAVRNFVRAAVRGNWAKAPAYLVLLGDGSYDYKNLTGKAAPGQPALYVPTYENGYITGYALPYASEDWLFDADVDRFVLPDVAGGRLPVSDPATALRLVRDKVIAYDADPEHTEWKNRVCLVADDFYQGARPDPITHLLDTVNLEENHLPGSFERVLVYLYKYPYGPGDTKPGATADLKRAIQEGVLAVNYIGHGSPFKIADESVLLNSDAETFTNLQRTGLFVAASCDVAKFSDPAIASLGERLLLHTGGGSIAIVAATELGFAGANVALNRTLYDLLFRRNDTEPGFPTPIGLALQVAKSLFPNENSRRYPLLGDPGTVLAAPRLWADLRLFDAAGAPLNLVTRGQTVEVRGTVYDNPGYSSPRPMEGFASLLVEDAAPRDTAFSPFGYNIPYNGTRAPMFRGDVVVSNGQFTARFIVPADARVGPLGRVRAYLRGSVGGAVPDSDGVGAIDVPVDRGTLPVGDDAGPTIALSFPGGATDVRPGAQLRVDISDPSGVLITGHNPANSIFVTLDGNTNTRADITSTFRYANNSYQQGTAFFALARDIALGPHEVTVSAADNLAVGVQAARHRSRASLQFSVSQNPALRIVRTFAFPNPMRSGSPTRIVVDAQGGAVNCLVRIYTVSGRLVRTLKDFGGLGQIQIPWNGLDDEGQALANGVYLYRIQVNGQEPDGSSSPRQMATAEGRIVVVN